MSKPKCLLRLRLCYCFGFRGRYYEEMYSPYRKWWLQLFEWCKILVSGRSLCWGQWAQPTHLAVVMRNKGSIGVTGREEESAWKWEGELEEQEHRRGVGNQGCLLQILFLRLHLGKTEMHPHCHPPQQPLPPLGAALPRVTGLTFFLRKAQTLQKYNYHQLRSCLPPSICYIVLQLRSYQSCEKTQVM